MKILAVIFLLLFCSSLSFGESCASYARVDDKTYRKALAKLDAIFYGEVVATNKPINAGSEIIDGPEILRVKVTRAWKGWEGMEAAEISVVYNAAYEPFEKEAGPIGTRSIFYAWKQINDPNLHVGFCSFISFDDEKTKRLLGKGKLLEQTAPQSPPPTQNVFLSSSEKNYSFFGWLK